jgi:hypothetical protein
VSYSSDQRIFERAYERWREPTDDFAVDGDVIKELTETYQLAWLTGHPEIKSKVLTFVTKAVPEDGWRMIEEAVQDSTLSIVVQGLVAALAYFRRKPVDPSKEFIDSLQYRVLSNQHDETRILALDVLQRIGSTYAKERLRALEAQAHQLGPEVERRLR